MNAAAVIIFLATMTVAKHHHRSHRKSIEVREFFLKINEAVHTHMEDIFESINLYDNFTYESNIKKLLTMHHDLSNIAEESIDALQEVQKAAHVNNVNRTEDRVRLDNAVEQTLKESKLDVYEQIKGKHKHKHNSKLDSTEVDRSAELAKSIIEFLDDVNNATVKNLWEPSQAKNRRVSFRRNLKIWKPPPNIKVHINSKTRRVFNGMKTTIKMFPFIVSIHIMGEFACAGSIISRDIIITAATCLQESYSNRSKLNPKSIYVRLGSDYITSDGETIPVQDLHFHPDYDSDILRNNLVLIRLEKRIRFSKQQPLIRRIEYDTARQGLDPDEEGVLILGWGATKEDQTVNVNQKLTMDDLDQFQWDTCKDLYSEDYVNAENFCAAKINKRGGACNGDVGGPGVIGPKLMGIISFGAPVCGSTDAPTVFTKLGYYADWINSVLKSKPERRSAMTYPSRIARRNISDTQLMSRIYESIQSARSKFRGRDEYPEEVTVLKEILSELVKSNTGMVDELMYGDLYADFNEIFEGSEKLPVSQHVLVNKSLYPIPEVHYDAPREYLTVTLTTSHTKSRLAKIGGSTPSNGLGRAIKPIGVESSGHHNSDESVSSKEAIAHELSVELLSSSSNTKIKHQETKHKKYTAHDKHREHEKTKKPAPPTTTTSKAHFSTSKDKIFDKIRIASNDKNENIGNMFYNLFDKGINVIKKTFSNNIFSTAENDKDNVNSSKKNSKSIIVHENDKDNNIHSRNQNDMIINVDNYKLTVNRINQSYDDEYDESVYDIDVDESESESETEEKHSVQSKKTTVKTKSKSHSKKETSNVGKKKMYSGKKTIRTSNKNSQESEDYSYTKHPEAVGTQMNLWYNL